MMGEMSVDYQIILVASAIILLIYPAMLLWGYLKGQYEYIEEAKYRIIEMEEQDAD